MASPAAWTRHLSMACTVLLLATAAAVHAAALNVAGLNEAVDRSLAPAWLDVADARGRAENGTVVALDLLVRGHGAGAVALEALSARASDGSTVSFAGARAVRDADGSVAGGALGDGDAARLTLDLSELAAPWRAGEEVALALDAPGMARLRLALASPDALGEGWVAVDVLAAV